MAWNMFTDAARSLTFLEPGVIGLVESFKLRLRSLQINSGAQITDILHGSKSYNPASIGGGNTQSTDVTVTGAAVGDTCIASQTTATTTASLTMSCRVTSANTCTVVFINNTGGSYDMGDGTMHCLVFKAS